MHQLPALPGAAWYGVLLLAAAALLQARRLWPLLAALAAFAWTAHAASGRLAERLPPESHGADFAVSGWVDAFPSARPGQVSFSFAVESPSDGSVPRRLRLTWYSPPAPLTAGQRLDLTVRLRPPRGLRNPGGFDYERWLFTAGYGATGYVRSGDAVSGETAGPLARRWLLFRAALAERIRAAAPDEQSGALLTALSIGERSGFAERHWDDFRRTGTSHLVAVSGMHVALFGMLAFFLVRCAWLRLPTAAAAYDLEGAALASAVATVFYTFLTGFELPAQRSMLMILVGLCLLVSRRTVDAWHAVAAALLAVLAWDPFAPLAASFWLSFGAVALLLLLGAPRPIRAARSGARLWRALGTMTALQWAIGIALLPLSAIFFGEISLVGPLVNLIAIPWFNVLLVPLTLAATALLPLEPLGDAAMALAGHLAGATLAALSDIAALDAAALGVPQPAPFAAGLACVASLLALPANPLPARRLAWLGLVPLFAPAPAKLARGEAEITMLDVGHGLAVLVETRAHRLLFDAGPRYPSGFDIGRDVVVPLVARGGLDKLVVSHADNDHAGGAPAVRESLPRVDLLRGPDVSFAAGQPCRDGQRWTWDDVELAVLHPPPAFNPLGNESSCVLKVSARGASVLITGDVERRAEQRLARDSRVRADAVIVPHHGSATSSSPAFVAATGARLALVSAGHANRWGFPRAEVRRRWEDAGAVLWVTGDVGAVTLTLGADGPVVTAERLRQHRYWHAPPP